VLEGISFGLAITPPGTLVMQWFGDGEWLSINTGGSPSDHRQPGHPQDSHEC
jgi:hypothetical protein